MKYKFAFAIRKYAATGGDTPEKRESTKKLLEGAHDAALGIALGLPVGTTTVGALGGAGTGYLLGKAFGKDAKRWGIGGALAGGGIGLGAAAPFSAVGLMGAHESNKIRKAIEKEGHYCAKYGALRSERTEGGKEKTAGNRVTVTYDRMPASTPREAVMALLTQLRSKYSRKLPDYYAGHSKDTILRNLDRGINRIKKDPALFNDPEGLLQDMRTESLLKAVGIPAVSGIGGAGVGGIGGYLLGKAVGSKNPGMWGLGGGLLGAGAGLGISIPLTKSHREDLKFTNDVLDNMDMR